MDKLEIPQWIGLNELDIRITKDAAGSFAIQICFVILSLASSIIFARLLGANDYGVYSNAIAWVNILTVLASFGFGTLLVREVAILRAQNETALLKGLIQFSDGFVFVLSILLIAVLAEVAAIMFSGTGKETMFWSLIFAAPLIPLWAFAILRQSAIRGLEKTLHAMMPDAIIRPLLTLTGVCLFYFWGNSKINSSLTIFVNVTSSAVALMAAVAWLNKFFPKEIYDVIAKHKITAWFKSTVPLFFLNGAQILVAQSPIVLLGIFGTAADVGAMNVAFRLMQIMIYLPSAIGTAISPVMARMYASGEKGRLQKILRPITLITFLSSAFLGLVFFLFGEKILSVFGTEFIVAQKALMILVLGSLLDSALGYSSLLLTMSSKERPVAIFFNLTAFAIIGLTILFVPYYGIAGAAFAFMIGMSVNRMLLAGFVIKDLKMNITIFSWFFRY
jgi:O-antigen/teichoic acid export membrane protein